MQRLQTIAREIYGLFVDDVSFAVAIVIWIVLDRLALTRIGLPPVAEGPILFAGLAVILLESTLRRARRG
jgi:hypothetical protein